MRQQPEMSHSPAYYQDGGHLMTAFPHDFTSSTATPAAPPPPPPPPAAARLPSRPDPSRSRHSRQSPSEFSAGRDNHYRHGHRQSHNHHHQHHHRHHYRHPVSGEAMGSDPEPPASASHREDGSIVTRGSNSTGRKERTRGSLSEHSSYMSGERRRMPKRAVQEDVPVPNDNQDALLMLFRLSIPVPIFAFCASFYTVFGLLFAILVSPFRLCSPASSYLRNTSFRTQVCDLLAPALHVHERLVGLNPPPRRRSSASQWVYDDPDTSSPVDPGDGFSFGGLIAVLLLSPFLSLALLLIAWIAAFFWVFAMVLGNPDGTERKDDGRAAVLGVCRWWQMWLSKARRKSR